MPLSDSVFEPLPSFKLRLPQRLKITPVVQRLVEKWGEPGVGHHQDASANLLEIIAQKLTRSRGDLAPLSHKERKAVIHLLWKTKPAWGTPEGFVARWLEWVDEAWRPAAAVKRLWRHHLLRFDPNSVVTRHVAEWLAKRKKHLPVPYQEFTSKWRLLNVENSAGAIAKSVMADDEFINEVRSLGMSRTAIESSALMAAVLEAVGQGLLAGKTMPTPQARMTNLFEDPATALRKIDAPKQVLHQTRGRFADGLVYAAVRRRDPAYEQEVLELLLQLLDDPRISPISWDGVSEETTRQIEAWLSKKTLDTFFLIIDRLQTDVPHQWPYRKAFWEGYLPHITRAWLLCGKNAREVAMRTKTSFGSIKGRGIVADHCALMLQIGDIVVIEMNKNAKALFFHGSALRKLKFYQVDPPYDRGDLIDNAQEQMAHNGSERDIWQSDFAGYIEEHTGIRRRKF